MLRQEWLVLDLWAKECLQEVACDANTRNGAAFEVAQREMNYLYEQDESPALTTLRWPNVLGALKRS